MSENYNQIPPYAASANSNKKFNLLEDTQKIIKEFNYQLNIYLDNLKKVETSDELIKINDEYVVIFENFDKNLNQLDKFSISFFLEYVVKLINAKKEMDVKKYLEFIETFQKNIEIIKFAVFLLNPS